MPNKKIKKRKIKNNTFNPVIALGTVYPDWLFHFAHFTALEQENINEKLPASQPTKIKVNFFPRF